MNAKKLMTRGDQLALRLHDAVVRFPFLTILIVVAVTVAAATGARHLEFSNNYRVFFSPQNPDLVAFEEFQATYTKNDNILFVIQPADKTVFKPNFTGAIEKITTRAWEMPFAIRVDSITNFQHTWADGDDLTVEDLIRDGPQQSADYIKSRGEIAMAEPLLSGNLIALDGGTTGINVTLQYPEKDLTEVPRAAAFARELAQEVMDEYPDVHIALSGVSMLNNAFAESGQQDAATLMPLMFGVLILFMLIVLRSISATIATLSIVGLATATAMGMAGTLGIKLTPISVTAPVIILTLAIADAIHILVSMLSAMREGVPRKEALRESMRINFLAVVVTSVTTLVGFLALNFSDAPPFHDLGNITAMGIAAAFTYSVTFLPALLSIIPLRVKERASGGPGRLQKMVEGLGELVTRRHRTVLAISSISTVGLIALVSLVDLNDQWVKYFDYRVQFRSDAEFAIDNLSGIYLVEFSLPSGEAEGISDPSYLERLDAFTTWLRAQPEAKHVYSFADIQKRLNKNMHGDDESYYRLPQERDLAAQYLLLYELSLPFGLDLNDRVSVDKSATRVTVTIGDLSTRETRSFLSRAENWIAANTPSHMQTVATGASVLFSRISERNIKSMLSGNVIAVLMIAVIMVIALRSFGLGAMSLIPNTVPTLIAFGVWGLLVGKVGMAAATVSASSLGIIVDDTVHLLSKYIRARRERGLSKPEAVRYAFRTVGVAIVSTTLILTAGFLILSMSTFRINHELGLLTAITIVIALIADFTLLPSLLLLGSKKEETQEVQSASKLASAS